MRASLHVENMGNMMRRPASEIDISAWPTGATELIEDSQNPTSRTHHILNSPITVIFDANPILCRHCGQPRNQGQPAGAMEPMKNMGDMPEGGGRWVPP